jgi:hypothetical protein
MSEAGIAGSRRRVLRALLLFTIGSLLAVMLGAVVMAQGGVPLGIWIRNPIAWLVTLGLGFALALRGWLTGWVAPAALALVALSFLGPEQEGVHRWLGLGPVQLNAAALILPVAIAAFLYERAMLAVPCFVLVAVALALQPDISQLAGLSLAAIILAYARFAWRGAAIALIIAAGAIALCLSRPDPLAPVPHVEGIFHLAWSQSPLLAIAMRAALAAAVISPLLLWRAARVNWAALALSAYFAATAFAPALGAYPVPLAGYGMSFVIGWVLGFLALASPAAVRKARG